MANLTTSNIVGSSSPTTWSQAQTIVYSGDHQAMIVIQLTCRDSDSLVDLVSVGSEILAEIEKKGQEGVEEVISQLAQGLQIEILVGTLRGASLQLYGQGGVSAYLARGGQLAKLENNSIGTLKEGDTVVLATAKFVEVVGITKLKEILSRDEEPAELLAPLVHTEAETSGVAASVGIFKTTKKVTTKWPLIRLRSEPSRKINLWIGGAILLLLIMMVGVGMVRRTKVENAREYESLNTSVSQKIGETQTEAELNPERVRQLLSQARGAVEAYLATKVKDEYRAMGVKLMAEIDKAEERAFKKNEIKLETVVELSILSEELKANKMKSDGKGNLIFLDTTSFKIVSMNLTDRSRRVINADNSEEFRDLGVSETKVYGLNTTGVMELVWKGDGSKKAIEPDEFWKEPTNIAMFAGNAYILDKGQGEIWKYPTLGETFGGRRRWFAVGIAPDLINVVDMKVVGDIWLLTSTGKLERYSRGAPVSFSMDGFPAKGEAKRFSAPAAMWVSESLVYVLENGAGRVVVIGLDGKFQAQYVNDEFEKASDLVVLDDKGYVLIDNVVKEFGL